MLQARKTLLSVEDAYLSYGAVVALNGLSLELYAGELLGLLGPQRCWQDDFDQLSVASPIAGPRPHLFGRRWFASRCAGIVPQEIAIYPTCRFFRIYKFLVACMVCQPFVNRAHRCGAAVGVAR